MYHEFDFEPARKYDLIFWELLYGLTYPIKIPFFLELLYDRDL